MLALYFRVTPLRRGCESPLSYVSLYGSAAKGLNQSRWTNLCRISPIQPDPRHLYPATLLAEVPRRERSLAYMDLAESHHSYRRTHRRNAVIATVSPTVRPSLPYHLVISQRSKLRPRSAPIDRYEYWILTSQGINGVKCVLALPLNSMEAYHGAGPPASPLSAGKMYVRRMLG